MATDNEKFIGSVESLKTFMAMEIASLRAEMMQTHALAQRTSAQISDLQARYSSERRAISGSVSLKSTSGNMPNHVKTAMLTRLLQSRQSAPKSAPEGSSNNVKWSPPRPPSPSGGAPSTNQLAHVISSYPDHSDSQDTQSDIAEPEPSPALLPGAADTGCEDLKQNDRDASSDPIADASASHPDSPQTKLQRGVSRYIAAAMNVKSTKPEEAAGDEADDKRKRAAAKSKGADDGAKNHPSCLDHTFDPNALGFVLIDLTFLVCTIIYCIALTWIWVSPVSDVDAATKTGLPDPQIIALFAVLPPLFWCWMVSRLFLRFKTGYEVIDDPGIIRDAYLKSRWFALDLFLAIPFDFIFLLYPPAFYVSLWRHPLLRAIRIIKLSESADPLLPSSRAWFRIPSMFGLIMCIANLAVCLFWRFESTDSTTGQPLTYVDCLYWVVATLSSTGYGDITARAQSTRGFAVGVMLTGMFIISATTATITNFLGTNDALEEEHSRMRHMMGSMLTHFSVPWQVRKDVMTLFPGVLAASSEAQFRTMTRLLPAFMEDRVANYIRMKLLRQVPLFAATTEDQDVLLNLSQKMQAVVAQPLEFIITAGEIGNEMFFLLAGSVDVLIPTGRSITTPDGICEPEETRVATLRSGSFFGEIALIEDMPRTASVLALQPCELLVLTREAFLDVCKISPLLQSSLETAVRQRREDIARKVEQAKR